MDLLDSLIKRHLLRAYSDLNGFGCLQIVADEGQAVGLLHGVVDVLCDASCIFHDKNVVKASNDNSKSVPRLICQRATSGNILEPALTKLQTNDLLSLVFSPSDG